MQLRPFRLERYYATWEFTTRYMLSSSDCETVAIADLLELEPDAHARLLDQRCGYTESAGSDELRRAISQLYTSIGPADALVCSCAEEGIFLVMHALLGPADHAIIETPCYESALQLARSTGARVSEWPRSFADGWAHDLEALERLIQPQTRLLYINQPHNPTGTLMVPATFKRVVELAGAHNLVLFSDEVYRESEHDPAARLPAACDIYERALSLGTVSKTYGLPGLRIGWLASRHAELLARIAELKDYTTICSSAPSELLAALALRHRHLLAQRNVDINRANLPVLEGFFERYANTFSWVRPNASSIGFPRVTGVSDVRAFCERIAAAHDVLLLPGSVYDEPGHVRVGYGRANMPEALAALEAALAAGAAP
jgi:aspartate/methionine/tyrosine aminotransferase